MQALGLDEIFDEIIREVDLPSETESLIAEKKRTDREAPFYYVL